MIKRANNSFEGPTAVSKIGKIGGLTHIYENIYFEILEKYCKILI